MLFRNALIDTMQRSSTVGLIAAACVACMVVGPSAARAQMPSDSAAYEQALQVEGPGQPLVNVARFRLQRIARAGNRGAMRELLAFMSRRDPTWLSAGEQLFAETIIADSTLLRRTARLEDLFRRASSGPLRQPGSQDEVVTAEVDFVRANRQGLQDIFDLGTPPEAERYFYNLLVNYVSVRGYRAQEELNGLVDRFAARFSSSPLVPIAERYIRRSYAESPFGAGFHAGYGVGLFSGSLGDRFTRAHGVVLGGELYLHEATLALWMMFGVAHQPEPLELRGARWRAGNALLTNIALDGGYEFRFGRLALTPLVGLGIENLRASDSTGADLALLPHTNDGLGVDAALLVSWRVPFDVGPHLDFRLRVGSTIAALGNYDPALAGSFWYLQFGLALIQRPYQAKEL